MAQQLQQHTGGFCKVFFHYVPSLDFTEQFLTHTLTRQVARSYTAVKIANEVETSFSGENISYWTKIELQDEVGFQELERLLLAKWFEYAEDAAWLEFLPMERRMYKISYNTKVSFEDVGLYGGALVCSNQFVSHWDTTLSNDGLLFLPTKSTWKTTFDYTKELIEIKRQENVQIPFTQIEERIVVDHHERSWYIYLGLKQVPKVYTDYHQIPKRALSIQQIDKKDFGNTSVICLNIPEKPYGGSELESKKGIQKLLTMLRQCGFKLAFATIKKKRPREEDLTRALRFRTFEIEYGWQCLLSCGFKVTDSLTSESIPILQKHCSALTPDVFQLMASKAESNQFFDFNTSFMECLQEVKNSWKTDDEAKEPHLTMCRRLVVTPSREIPMAKEPIISNRVIRQYNHDYFIRVIFRDEDFTKLSGDGLTILSDRIRDFMDKGFTIGSRHYEFLACSNSQLRDHGVWFFSPYGGLTSEKIRNYIGDFKEERCVATYVSRMGLCFSATKDTFEVDDKNVAFIGDIKHESYCFTDGIGKISLSLAKKVAKSLELDRVPSAFQIRYGGCKGVVALDPTLGDRNDLLHISTSMKKFDSPSKHLEILDTTRPAQLHLNRQVITLMSGLGVPDHAFLDLQETMLFDMADMLLFDHKAMQALNEVNLGIKYVDLRNAGVSFTTNVFFRSVLLTIYKNKLKELTRKARIEIPIDKGRIMMGTVDATGILDYGQVFVSYTKIGEVSSRDVDILKTQVVVTKNPCFHPGDLRKFQAVDVPELHHLVDCIVFPQNEPRPHPDEMSGSGLDGDKYFVCWDLKLLPPGENKSPMDFLKREKKKLLRSIEVQDTTEFISRYIQVDQLGVIANAHVVHADSKDIFCTECEQLCEMHSDAVDFPNTGQAPRLITSLRPTKYPDFMMKSDKPLYTSKKILGKIYHQCRSLEQANSRTCDIDLHQPSVTMEKEMIYPGYERFMDSARQFVNRYNDKIFQLMTIYGIGSEVEVVTGIIHSFNTKRSYLPNERFNISQVIKAKVKAIRQKCREDFFNEFGGQEHCFHNIGNGKYASLAKASACYVTSCKQTSNGKLMVSCPWILSDLLAIIKSSPQRQNSVQDKIGSSLYEQSISNDEKQRKISKRLFSVTHQVKRKLAQNVTVCAIGLPTLYLADISCADVDVYVELPLTGQELSEILCEAFNGYKNIKPLSFSIPTDRGQVNVTFTSDAVLRDRTHFIDRQLRDCPLYTPIIVFLLGWARKYDLIGISTGAVFTEDEFVILILIILGQRCNRSWIPRNEKENMAFLLMNFLRILMTKMKPNEAGEVKMIELDPTYPKEKRLLIPRILRSQQCYHMRDEILFAYQEIAKNSSVAVFFDQPVQENSMTMDLSVSALRSVMNAETYVEKQLCKRFGAEVKIHSLQYRDTPGRMLEAWGSPEQLWNIRQSLHDLENNVTISTTVGKKDLLFSDGAFKRVYNGSTTPEDQLILDRYNGRGNPNHKEKELYTASPNTSNSSNAFNSTAFTQFFTERLHILRQDYVRLYHGKLWIALTFGVYYLFNVDRKAYTIEELESKLSENQEMVLPDPKIFHRNRIQRHIRGAFVPQECNQRIVEAILEELSFQHKHTHVKFQARVNVHNERNTGLLELDENLNIIEMRLTAFKWMAVDICRGLNHTGSKRMDVRCKLQSERKLDVKNKSRTILFRDDQNHLKAVPGVTFAREKHVKRYQYSGKDSCHRVLKDMDIEISAVREFSDLSNDGTFSHVVPRTELTLVPKLPSLDQGNDEWDEYIKGLSEVVEYFADRLD